MDRVTTNYQHTKYQIPNTNYQLPITKSPNTNYQLPSTKYQLPTTKYQLPNTKYQIPTYHLPITNYQIPTTNYQIPITKYQLPNTNYQIPITKYQLPNTKYHPKMAVDKTKMHNFKELNVWNISMEIAEEVNLMVEAMPTHQIWTLGSQLLKTSVSIPSNIAEGCGRASNNQLYYFLNVAMASTFELETQILLAIRFKAVDKEKAEATIKKLDSVQKMTRKLMDSVLKRK